MTAQAGARREAYVIGRPAFALLAPSRWPASRVSATRVGVAMNQARSPAFAGYLAGQAGVTHLVASFRVPGVACGQQETAISPGAFLFTGPTDRLDLNAANVIVGCYRGVPNAQEALVVNGAEYDFARQIQPGDLVRARLTDTPGQQTVVQLRDLTAPRRFVLTHSGRGATPQAQLIGDWGSEDAQTGAQIPPPDFAPTTFSAISVDRHALGTSGPTRYDMATSSNVLQIGTGPLLGAARDRFTCTRQVA